MMKQQMIIIQIMQETVNCMSVIFKRSNRWVVLPVSTRCDGGSGKRKCTRQEHRWAPILLLSATYGGQVGWMHTHTLSLDWTGSPVLAGRWGEGRCQRQQMPCTPVLEEPLLFLLPFEIHGFCVLWLSMFGFDMLCHFGWFYLSASVGVRGPGASGTWAEGLTSLEWLRCLNVYPLGFCLTIPSCRSVVACGAVNPISSTESLSHT